jgi:hypothetical protein
MMSSFVSKYPRCQTCKNVFQDGTDEIKGFAEDEAQPGYCELCAATGVLHKITIEKEEEKGEPTLAPQTIIIYSRPSAASPPTPYVQWDSSAYETRLGAIEVALWWAELLEHVPEAFKWAVVFELENPRITFMYAPLIAIGHPPTYRRFADKNVLDFAGPAVARIVPSGDGPPVRYAGLLSLRAPHDIKWYEDDGSMSGHFPALLMQLGGATQISSIPMRQWEYMCNHSAVFRRHFFCVAPEKKNPK